MREERFSTLDVAGSIPVSRSAFKSLSGLAFPRFRSFPQNVFEHARC